MSREWDDADEPERTMVVEPMTPITAFIERMKAWALEARQTPWEYDCRWCEDTGWTVHVCPTEWQCERGADSICRRVEGYTHTYVRPCGCRPTNPTYRRHHPLGPATESDAMAAAASTRRTKR